MGANFHTAYTDGTTIFAASSMEAPLSDLDRAISYGKNVIVHCDGVLVYSPDSGEITWSGALRILFVRADGQLIQNIVPTGGVTLTDNQMAYVDLSETSDAAVAVYAVSLTTAAASATKAYNRLVLGYRNAASDAFYPVVLREPMATPASGGGGGASFQTIAVSGQDDVVADAEGDTLTVAAGSNVTITTNSVSKTVTIAASGSSGASVNLWQLML